MFLIGNKAEKDSLNTTKNRVDTGCHVCYLRISDTSESRDGSAASRLGSRFRERSRALGPAEARRISERGGKRVQRKLDLRQVLPHDFSISAKKIRSLWLLIVPCLSQFARFCYFSVSSRSRLQWVRWRSCLQSCWSRELGAI